MPKLGMTAPTKSINIVETWRIGNHAMLFLGRPVGSSRGEDPSVRVVVRVRAAAKSSLRCRFGRSFGLEL